MVQKKKHRISPDQILVPQCTTTRNQDLGHLVVLDQLIRLGLPDVEF
jgi:hypothetical protein